MGPCFRRDDAFLGRYACMEKRWVSLRSTYPTKTVPQVAPDAAGIAACMRLAHANADVTPDQIDYICAHGTGTPANDATEVAAIREVFGPTPPPVSSIKSMLGHTMGASSGFGVIACVLAINGGYLPPTINWSHTDDALGTLDVIPNHARPGVVRFVQNDGFAFAGNNAIVVLAAA